MRVNIRALAAEISDLVREAFDLVREVSAVPDQASDANATAPVRTPRIRIDFRI